MHKSGVVKEEGFGSVHPTVNHLVNSVTEPQRRELFDFFFLSDDDESTVCTTAAAAAGWLAGSSPIDRIVRSTD